MWRVELDHKPDLVVFDLDGTLYNYELAHTFALESILKTFGNIFGLGDELAISLYDSARKVVQERHLGQASSHNRLLYLTEMVTKFNLNAATLIELESIYWIKFFSKMELTEDCESFLELLKMSSISTALVSDFETRIQFRKLTLLNLENYFDYIVSSEIAGGEKSTGKPFSLLAKQLRFKPKNVWFIGDNLQDFPELFLDAATKNFMISRVENPEHKDRITHFRTYTFLSERLNI